MSFGGAMDRILISDNGTIHTYAELAGAARSIAGLIGEVSAGALIAVEAGSRLNRLAAVYGAWSRNCVPLLLDSSTPEAYREMILDDIGGVAARVDDALLSKLEGSAAAGVPDDEILRITGSIACPAVKDGGFVLCTLTAGALEERFRFCKDVLGISFGQTFFPEKPLWLEVFTVMDGGTFCGGAQADCTCLAAPAGRCIGLLEGSGCRPESVLTYGCQPVEGLHAYFKKAGIKHYNIFDMPYFRFFSSGEGMEARPAAFVRAYAVSSSGAVQPAGMNGRLYVVTEDGDKAVCTADGGFKAADTGFTARRLKKGSFGISGASGFAVSSEGETVSGELARRVLEGSGLTEKMTVEESGGRVDIFCRTNAPLREIYRVLGEGLPVEYQSVRVYKTMNTKLRELLFTFADSSELERQLSAASGSDVKCEPVPDEPGAMFISCGGDISACDAFLSADGRVRTARFLLPDGSITVKEYGSADERLVEVTELFSMASGKTDYLPDDDFFDAGGDSIAFIQLVTLIQEKLGAVDVNRLYVMPTPRSCVSLLSGDEVSTAASTAGKEQLLADIVPDKLSVPERVSEEQGIFLTNAWSFAGTFILSKLLSSFSGKIFCLTSGNGHDSIRQALERCGIPEVPGEGRVILLSGDPGRERFGLSSADYEKVAEHTCVIIHNCSRADMLASYDSLRELNIGSVRETLRLAAEKSRKRVIYISAMGVFEEFMKSGRRADERTDLSDYPPSVYAYNQTMWAAERLAEQSREQGIRTDIFRITTLCGDSERGVWRSDELIKHLCRICIGIGAYSDFSVRTRLIPVDRAAAAVAAAAMDVQRIEGMTFHILGDRAIELSELLRWIAEDGKAFEHLSFEEWLSRAESFTKSSGEPELMAVMGILSSGKSNVYSEITSLIDSQKTTDYFSARSTFLGSPDREEFLRSTRYIALKDRI